MAIPTNDRACYRHPDRMGGIICQRCDRPICPSCMHQASVGFHCPECSRQGAQKVVQGVQAFRSRPIVTQVLIAVNVAVFLIGALVSPNSVVGRTTGRLGIDGGLYGPLVPDEPWRLLTAGFLHAGIIHVGLNMWVLWVLGRMVEPALGKLRFGVLYLTALLAGSLGALILTPESLTVGASGAIFGLMGAAVVIARDRNISLMASGLLPTLGLNLVLTFGIGGISIGGHIGGLVGGLLVGYVLVEGRNRVKNDVAPAVVAGVVGVGIAIASYALMLSQYGEAVVRVN